MAKRKGTAGKQIRKTNGSVKLDRNKVDQSKGVYVFGAREHNLQDIDTFIPRNKFVVITGISGSGKSTLAFDTIFAEGQRRYVESLSAYARQFLGQMKKPDVDLIEGLSPAISIDQKSRSSNPRSTVGTVTEIYDHLRLLYARIGVPHCPECGLVVQQQTVPQIVDQLLEEYENKVLYVAACVVRDRKGTYNAIFKRYLAQGFARIIIDGEEHELEDLVERVESQKYTLDRYKVHTIHVVTDRVKVTKQNLKRLSDSVETAMQYAEGSVDISVRPTKNKGFDFKTHSLKRACPDCGKSFDELAPRNFSFNNPHGACPNCHGLGYLLAIDEDLVIPDPTLNIYDGAIKPFASTFQSYMQQILDSVLTYYDASPLTPWEDLPDEVKDVILHGSGNTRIPYLLTGDDRSYQYKKPFEGVIPMLERRYRETTSSGMKELYEKYMSQDKCPVCEGMRLRPESRAVTINDRSIMDVTTFSINEAYDFFDGIMDDLSDRDRLIAKEVVKEIKARLGFLKDVGLDYVTLDRAASTLSGGESQRIRLATQIGSGLVGVLYVLDEPSIGLHQRDNDRLIATLKRLRDLGNTLIVVEHDTETMLQADHIIDLGPGAGRNGGNVVAEGSPEKIMKNKSSLTGKYLSGKESIPIPEKRQEPNGKEIVVKGCKEHNLKDVDFHIPLGCFICVTGVSGSGKSTFVDDILYRSLARYFYRASDAPGKHDMIEGLENIDKVIIIDQSPIGRTPRSNPATYTNVFTPIREVFASTQHARKWGYKPGRFSFNVKGGRCEACGGAGLIKIEMQFLPDVYIPCDTCKGKRYERETLEVQYNGRNIHEVLNMSVEEALEFFHPIPKIRRKLQTLYDVGLTYVQLGQPATTLSGGEAQRVKLATELSKKATGKTLYLLDEPTTGLHFEDIKKLLAVLLRLRKQGNTILVIEHNMDVIKCADQIIDLGPEGGDGGGQIVATGTPEEISKSGSYTGEYLKQVLKDAKTADW